MAIVVSHIDSDFDTLCRRALRQAPLADLIELRLDRIGDPGEALAEFIRTCPKRVIVAAPAGSTGGEFTGDVDEQLDLLRAAALAGAAFVDVDWTLSLHLGEVENKCHRIVSRHDREGTPEDLGPFLAEVEELLYEGDLIKLVPLARSTEDGMRMLCLLRERGGGLIGFCSGEAGSFTRVLAPIFGSPFTYAAPASMPGEPAGQATAPGQIPVNDLRALYPPGGMGPETAILGVVGNPIGGSFSPRVHGMALKAARLDAVYVPFEPRDLDAFLDLAVDENFRGFSITAPFKRAAFERAAHRDAESSATGAANTLVRDGSGWRCMNTDVAGIEETLSGAFAFHSREPGRPVALAVAHTLVLGTGGAARAAARVVSRAGGRLTVAGRDRAAATALAVDFGGEAASWEAVGEVDYDVLIQATPVGSLAQPGESPIPAGSIRPGTLVLDAVYRPIKTPFLAAAMERGCTPVPGGEWFVRQAREQFRLLTNTEPDEKLLRAAFEHALGAAVDGP